MSNDIAVLIAGSTGLVGAQCLNFLLQHEQVGKVIAPTRQPLTMTSQSPVLLNPQVDFNEIEQASELFSVDAIICALGTTQKKAGNKAAFRQVDFSYCYELAKAGRAQGVKSFHIVSAVGASTQSLSFYSRVKGELEAALKTLGYPTLSIYQPSLLLGQRNEHRFAEELGMKVSGVFNLLMMGKLSQFKAIESSVLAQALCNEAVATAREGVSKGLSVYHYDAIQKLANSGNTAGQ